MASREYIAKKVVTGGLQSCWGYSPKKQVQVWQKAYDHMNISVKVGTAFSEGTEIFTFRGNNAETEQADAFMKEVKQRFPLGNFYGEVAMVEECFEKYGRETA